MEPRKKISEFIANNIITNGENVELDYETNLLRSGLIDSMSLMTLVNFIESEFEIDVPFTEFTITNFMSVNAMTEYIQNKKAS